MPVIASTNQKCLFCVDLCDGVDAFFQQLLYYIIIMVLFVIQSFAKSGNPIFSDNSLVFYKPNSLAHATGSTGVRNSRTKARRT